ncbi:Gfo/Idh/MocA family protein [Vallitalea okinawensis]|uniref:Gfo/Idh/MocA family protein n=1 Tax=Vallitalea okinawensis TaxID=2078660 RepID=UPI000CFBEC28|nr:Gfo/Idh/MocA family oxidoreductase [Vallitalea okinawensis]
MLGIGLIGCGAISNTHLKAIEDSINGKLVALCDIKEDKVKNLANQYKCKAYKNFNELVKDAKVDVIHICTPHYLHKEMIIEAIKAKKHVLCEKPIVMNMLDAEEIKNIGQENSKIAVCFQNRFNPTSMKIKDVIQAHTLGKLIGLKGYVTWYRDEKYYRESDWRGCFATEGGGVLINQSIHTLDLLQWFGGDIEWIKGNTSTRLLNEVIEVEDTADATIQFKNGTIGLFYATNCNVVNSPVELEVTFENGSLRMFNNSLYLIQKGEMKELIGDQVSGNAKSYWGKSHSILIDKFYQAIINNTEDYIHFDDGLTALKMIDGIYRSKGKEGIKL